MTEWQIRAEYTGALTEDQAEALVDDQPTMAIIDGDHSRVEIRTVYTVDDIDAAVDAGRDALTAMANLQHLVTVGVLTPQRIVVETTAAYRAEADLLGPADAAALLGVSGGRLRQLRADDRAFPPTIAIAGIEAYPRAPLEAYRDARGAAPRPAGRRRDSDVEVLNRGLALLLAHGDLDRVRVSQVATSMAAQGSRHLSGKALMLAQLTDDERVRVEAAVTGDELEAFRVAYARARELDPR